MKQIKRKFYRMCVVGFAFFLLRLGPACPVIAAEADIHFGSAWYEPSYEEDFPIGLYIDSTEKIGKYEIILSYDTQYLSFKGGAESVEDGKILVSGDLQGTSTKIMLQFHVLSAGNSSVAVQSATVQTADGSQMLDVKTLPAAPVKVKTDENTAFTEMYVNGVKIHDFQQDISEYEAELDFAEEFAVEIKGADHVETTVESTDADTCILHVAAADSQQKTTTYLITAHLQPYPEENKTEKSDPKEQAAVNEWNKTDITESDDPVETGVSLRDSLTEEELKRTIEQNRMDSMIKAGMILGILIIAMILFFAVPVIIGSRPDRDKNSGAGVNKGEFPFDKLD